MPTFNYIIVRSVNTAMAAKAKVGVAKKTSATLAKGVIKTNISLMKASPVVPKLISTVKQTNIGLLESNRDSSLSLLEHGNGLTSVPYCEYSKYVDPHGLPITYYDQQKISSLTEGNQANAFEILSSLDPGHGVYSHINNGEVAYVMKASARSGNQIRETFAEQFGLAFDAAGHPVKDGLSNHITDVKISLYYEAVEKIFLMDYNFTAYVLAKKIMLVEKFIDVSERCIILNRSNSLYNRTYNPHPNTSLFEVVEETIKAPPNVFSDSLNCKNPSFGIGNDIYKDYMTSSFLDLKIFVAELRLPPEIAVCYENMASWFGS